MGAKSNGERKEKNAEKAISRRAWPGRVVPKGKAVSGLAGGSRRTDPLIGGSVLPEEMHHRSVVGLPLAGVGQPMDAKNVLHYDNGLPRLF